MTDVFVGKGLQVTGAWRVQVTGDSCLDHGFWSRTRWQWVPVTTGWEQDIPLCAVSLWIPLQALESQQETTATISMAWCPPASTTWLCLCMCFPSTTSNFFMSHVLSNLGKKQEKGREPYIMIVELMVDFKFLGRRNNGLVLEVWFSYVCSGRRSWRKPWGVDEKSIFTL